MKKSLWSMSTTVRESKRIKGFLHVASIMEGDKWDHEAQKKFQCLLVQNREYLNDPSNGQTFQKLNKKQIRYLTDTETEMPFDVAVSIIESKKYVGGPEMRGRNSMAPLKKLGLVYLDSEKKLKISDLGKKFLNNEISDEEFFLDSLLKIQYPNPLDDSYKDMNIKPFIGIVHLIKKVNDLCKKAGMKQKGLSKDEFGIFALSLRDHADIDDYAKKVIAYRKSFERITDDDKKREFKENYINSFLSEYKEPLKNIPEYSDNMIRYFRQTKLFYLRGKYANTYFDLEPRRMNEINSLLENDDSAPIVFNSENDWINYFSTYGSYELPYETNPKLKSILENVVEENAKLSEGLGKEYVRPLFDSLEKSELKELIKKERLLRTSLQNLKIKSDYFGVDKIDEVIKYLGYILDHDRDKKLKNRMSLELEKWVNVALNVFNDATLIKPNTIVGDDNEPINTAPAGVADIECYYDSFSSICEVTTLTSRDQWVNEGQPVMRHLRAFEDKMPCQSYCLFVAPRLHQDTINTFWNSVKYEYQGRKQLIIPITISQLILMLRAVKILHQKNSVLRAEQLRQLYDECVSLDGVSSSLEWQPSIDKKISTWINNL